MADQSISQLPVATTLTGDELTVVVQNGITKQTQVADIANAVAPGKFIDYLYFDTGSDLIVVYTDTTTQNLGPIPGYIAASIRSDGHLILTNSTGGTTDAGSVFATLSQTFITKNNESATLPNSQQLIAGSNIALSYGTNSVTISTSGASGSLNGAGTGIIVKDTSTSVVARTLTSTAGISITNPDGIAGNPVISPSSKLANIQNLATTGILAVVGGTTVVDRNIVGTGSQITVVGGDGSANPTISIASNPVLPGTGSVTLPTGNTSQRPGDLPGQLRFNTTLNVFEGQNNSGIWQVLALGGGVTSITLGTGLTGSPNPITSTGTISITNTGVTAATYGSSTQVGQFAVNAQGQITSASNVSITPSSIGAISAINGTANEITSNQVGTVVTLSLPTALTFTGKTVTGGAFNMTSATVGSDTVTTNTATQTLTGKTISGASNTLTNIGNSSLTNSSLTVGSTNIALGATSLTLAGLTSVTVTQDPVSDLQLATKQYVDTVAQGLDAKASCVYSTTANITLSGLATQAGGDWPSTLTAGQRILVKNQSSSQFNGIYLANASTWTRALDMNTWAEVPSSFVFIEDGSTLADTGWVTTANGVGTIDVTPMPWVQFSGAGTYTAGTGLTLTGTQFSITNTAVTTGTYGSASRTITQTVNQQGQLTNIFDQPISIAPSQINATIPNSGLTNSSITINGSAISLGGSVSVGTVTSVAALTLGTTGTDLSSTVATGTTTPVITLNVPTASATNRGALSAADWTTFNSKAPGTTFTSTYVPYGQGTTTLNQSSSLTFDGTSLTTVNAVATAGLYAKGALTSTYTDGIVADYVTGNGRISVGAADGITFYNGGVANTALFTIPSTGNAVFNTTGAVTLPVGSTVQQPASPTVGMLRYNNTTNQFEGYSGASPAWASVGGAAIVNDTTTATPVYPLFAAATSGTALTIYTSNSNYLYTPSTGTLSAPKHVATAAITSATNQAPFSYGTLGFTDTNIFASMQSSVNSYNQFAIQNTSAGTAASAGYVAYNNNGTASTNYMTVGINSSGYTGTGSINGAGYGYLLSASTDMVIGTIGNNAIHFAVNSGATDALTIAATTGNVTTPNLLTGSAVRASNGIVVNSQTVSANYTIASGDSGMSSGPMTVASGVTVTVSSGSRWVVL